MLTTYQLDKDFVLVGAGEPRQHAAKPHLSVLVEPPALEEKMTAKWQTELEPINPEFGDPDTGEWVLEYDYRKADLYETATGEKYELGKEDPEGRTYDGVGELPAWLTDAERPSRHHKWENGGWVLDAAAELEAAKANKLLEIDAARDKDLKAGFEYDGHVYDSDDKSIQRINAIVTMSIANPDYSTPYITKNNDIVQLDAQGIAGLGAAAAAHESGLIFKARGLKDQVLEAKNAAEVTAIKWG